MKISISPSHRNQLPVSIILYILFTTMRLLKFTQCSIAVEGTTPDESDKQKQQELGEDPVNKEHEESEESVIFQYPDFDYVSSQRNEIAWREWVAACEQTPVCLGRIGLDKLKCVRKCLSRSCYQEIYAFDELEDGEIDVRATSFKGCFTLRIAKKRHWD